MVAHAPEHLEHVGKERLRTHPKNGTAHPA
jgi:hypothetical protein